MAKNLNEISIKDFTKLAATRQDDVDAAKATPLPAEETYSANWLKQQLHPEHQYFVDQELEKLHLRRKFIRHELFGEMHNPKEQEEYPKDRTVPEQVQISVIKEGVAKTINGSTDDSLLQILEKNGISAPSHCRSGECGWCHSRLVSGEVYAPASVDGRRVADKKFGFIHPCVSFPLTDLTIEVPDVR